MRAWLGVGWGGVVRGGVAWRGWGVMRTADTSRTPAWSAPRLILTPANPADIVITRKARRARVGVWKIPRFELDGTGSKENLIVLACSLGPNLTA